LLVLTTRDGANPMGSLLLDGSGNAYGTTVGGGYGAGTVFVLDGPTTRNLRLLHSFGGPDDFGLSPSGSVILDGSSHLYGVTAIDAIYRYGGVFELNTDGSAYSLLSRFENGADGVYPVGPLVLDAAGRLYGATVDSVFSMRSDGREVTALHSFS